MEELGPPPLQWCLLPKVACLFSLHVWPADGGEVFLQTEFLSRSYSGETFLICLFQFLVTPRYQMTLLLFCWFCGDLNV